MGKWETLAVAAAIILSAAVGLLNGVLNLMDPPDAVAPWEYREYGVEPPSDH
ncbi:MAG: hypothetical protein K2Y51_13735 [Gammaproteobacteria bacterium]|nr:hypothetical protein [Gammaproteobacteria bacterium]